MGKSSYLGVAPASEMSRLHASLLPSALFLASA
jgi:hypothetical protein